MGAILVAVAVLIIALAICAVVFKPKRMDETEIPPEERKRLERDVDDLREFVRRTAYVDAD